MILKRAMPLPRTISFALSRLKANGYEAYVVGGAVRDFLLGRTPEDYDVSTSADPEEILGCFPGERKDLSGARHGTVRVLLKGSPVEITSFRSESSYSDFRHPDEVRFIKSAKEDSFRRDFTINGLYYADGEILDFHGGVEDLQRKVVRTIGDPRDRFSEDALRMLRALRFKATLGFVVEEKTKEAILSLKDEIKSISSERIQRELFDLLRTSAFFTTIEEYAPLFEVFIPPLRDLNFSRYDFSSPSSRSPLASLASLFSLGGMGERYERWADDIRLKKEEKETIRTLLSLKDISFSKKWDEDELKGLLYLTHPLDPALLFTYFKELFSLRRLSRKNVEKAEEIAFSLLEKKQVILSLFDLDVDGKDVVRAGFQKGAIVGEVLHLLAIAVNEGQIENDRGQEMRWLKEVLHHRM